MRPNFWMWDNKNNNRHSLSPPTYCYIVNSVDYLNVYFPAPTGISEKENQI